MTKTKTLQDCWIKVATISGKPAEAIQFLLDTTGVILYEDASKPGLKVLDIYTDSDEFKYVFAEQKI
jgi:hypothetical protein